MLTELLALKEYMKKIDMFEECAELNEYIIEKFNDCTYPCNRIEKMYNLDEHFKDCTPTQIAQCIWASEHFDPHDEYFYQDCFSCLVSGSLTDMQNHIHNCQPNLIEDILSYELNEHLTDWLKEEDLFDTWEIGDIHDLYKYWDVLNDKNKSLLVDACFYRTWENLDIYDGIDAILRELRKEYGYTNLLSLIEETSKKGIRFSPIGAYVYYKEDK